MPPSGRCTAPAFASLSSLALPSKNKWSTGKWSPKAGEQEGPEWLPYQFSALIFTAQRPVALVSPLDSSITVFGDKIGLRLLDTKDTGSLGFLDLHRKACGVQASLTVRA